MQLRNNTIPLWRTHAPEITTFSGLMDERVKRTVERYRNSVSKSTPETCRTTRRPNG